MKHLSSMLLDSDKNRLQHILDSAREAVDFSKNTDFDTAQQNRQLQHALVRCMEIIGKAASRVSPDARQKLSTIPWQDMISMRNRMVHAYYDVDFSIVWRTVKEELPALIATIGPLIDE